MNAERITLFTVEIDDEKVLDSIVDLRKGIADYKKILADLKKEYEDGTKTEAEYLKAAEKIEQQIKRSNKEIQENRKVMENNNRINEASSGSLIEMRANLSLATAAYNALSKEQRDNAEAGGKLAEYIKDLSDNLKDEEEILGNHTRSVGDYAKALRDGSIQTVGTGKAIEHLKEALAEAEDAWDKLTEEERKNEEVGGVVAKQISKVSDEIEKQEKVQQKHSKTAKDYINDLKLGGNSVKEYGEAFRGGIQGVQTFTKGLSLGRIAAIAFTAVPIVVVLLGLVAILTKSQAGMDKLAQYTKAASLAIDALTQGFIEIGQIVIDSFSSWEKFLTLFTDIGTRSRQLGADMAAAAKQGMEIEKVNQQIEASEIALSVRVSKNRADIEKNKKLSEDVTKSQAVRSEAAKKAYALENETMKESIKLQQMRIDNIVKENKIGPPSRAKDRTLADAQVEYNNLVEDSVGKQTELQNKVNEIAAQAKASAEERRKALAADLVAEVETRLVNAKKLNKETFALEVELLKRRADAELVDSKKTANQRKLIAAKLSADIFDLNVKRMTEEAAKENAIKISGINAALVLVEKGSKAEEALTIARIDAESYERQKAIKERFELETDTLRLAAALGDEVNGTNSTKDAVRTQYKIARAAADYERAKRTVQATIDLDEFAYLRWKSIEEKKIDDEEAYQLELIDIERKANQISATEELSRRTAVQADAIRQRRELEERLTQVTLQQQKNEIDTKLANVKQGTQKELEIRLEAIEKERQIRLKAEKLTQDEIDKINAESNKQRNDVTTDFELTQSDRIVQQVANANQLLSTIFEAGIAKQTAAYEDQQKAFLKGAGNNAALRGKIEEQFAKRKEELEKDAAKKRQKIALLENVISLARGLVEAARIPVPFGAIQAAFVGATFIAQQAVISAQKFNKGGYFNYYPSNGKGVYLADGPGTATSDSINARLSVGETVINARSTAQNYDLLSAINVQGGGEAFPGAKPVPAGAASGYASGTVGFGYQESATLVDTVASAIRDIQPVLVLETVNQLQQQQNKTKQRTTISMD